MFLFFKKRLPLLVSFIIVAAISATMLGGIFISDGNKIDKSGDAASAASAEKSGEPDDKAAQKDVSLVKNVDADAKKAPKSTDANRVERSRSTSRGKTFSYAKVLEVKATAYDLSYESCGKLPGEPGYGITATGTKARKGVVAVDPNVIPLGSKLYIETLDGDVVCKEAFAEDTGSAIKGRKIDLFFDSKAECRYFGVKTLRVYVLD